MVNGETSLFEPELQALNQQGLTMADAGVRVGIGAGNGGGDL